MIEWKYSKYLLVTIIGVLALLLYNSLFPSLHRKTLMSFPPHQYAIAITPESVTVHMKSWQSDDFFIAGTSDTIDEHGNYFVQVFSQASSHYPKATYNSESLHKAKTILKDISKGKHKIFYKTLEKNYLLGEFSWPAQTNSYIISQRPYEEFEKMFKEIDEHSETKFPLTKEYFFQEYWIKGVRPVPPH